MSLILHFIVAAIAFSQVLASVPPKRSISCSNIPAPLVPGATVLSVTSKVRRDFTVGDAFPTLARNAAGLDICEVNVTLTHPGVNDTVQVQTWLPLDGWNSRFLAVGGGGWAARLGPFDLAAPASQGYAASSTDAGVPDDDPTTPAAWALNPDGTVNLGLLTNFASRSIHDMAVVGKALTASFYERPVGHSFWNGCSTGGRQGLISAQKYPEDFDGILAAAPAIYWTEFLVAELWPQVVMKEEGYYPSLCELDAIVQGGISACDGIDDVKDGVLNDPWKCDFDPFTMVDTKVTCDGRDINISHHTASVVRKIWDGPKTPSGKNLWFGMPIGASLAGLVNSTTVDGVSVGAPFPVADTWARFFVKANLEFDTTGLDTRGLNELFHDSERQYDSLIGTADPDLSGFKKSGGKLLVWHGSADQLIYPQDSVHYLEQVEDAVGGKAVTEDFFRLFLAPGVDHCGAGPTPGAVPTDPLGALVAWVENGTKPEVLEAETLPGSPSHFTRKVCRYPMVAKYRGQGDTAVADSYTCVRDE